MWQQANGSPEVCSLSDGRCPRSHLLGMSLEKRYHHLLCMPSLLGCSGLGVCPDTHVARLPCVCAVGSPRSPALRLLRDLRITIPCG